MNESKVKKDIEYTIESIRRHCSGYIHEKNLEAMKKEVCRRLDEMEESGYLDELKTLGEEITRDEEGKWPVTIVGDDVCLCSTLHLSQYLSFMSVDVLEEED